MKLLEEGLITAKVSPRCVQRFMKEWEAKNGPAAGAKDRKAFEAEYFGGIWQADSCHFPHIPGKDGKKSRTYLMAILDDHARLIVGARLFFSDNATNFQSVLKSAVATYGIPHILLVDRGGPYSCNQTAFICADIGTRIKHAPIADGAAKGKIERVW
jgi:transposase InsO family protein